MCVGVHVSVCVCKSKCNSHSALTPGWIARGGWILSGPSSSQHPLSPLPACNKCTDTAINLLNIPLIQKQQKGRRKKNNSPLPYDLGPWKVKLGTPRSLFIFVRAAAKLSTRTSFFSCRDMCFLFPKLRLRRVIIYF